MHHWEAHEHLADAVAVVAHCLAPGVDLPKSRCDQCLVALEVVEWACRIDQIAVEVEVHQVLDDGDLAWHHPETVVQVAHERMVLLEVASARHDHTLDLAVEGHDVEGHILAADGALELDRHRVQACLSLAAVVPEAALVLVLICWVDHMAVVDHSHFLARPVEQIAH